MSAVDTLRDALFGNPPSPVRQPSREGVLAAFTDLQLTTEAGIAAAALSGTDLDAAMVLVAPLLESAQAAQAAAEEVVANVSVLVEAEIDAAIASATTAAGNSAERAEVAAQANLAGTRYFPDRAAGEAGSATDQFFATDDGAGNLIYYRRTSGGSQEISRALTPASLAAALNGSVVTLTADLTLAEYAPRPGDGYVLNGHTLTVERMADTAQAGVFIGAGTVVIRSGHARPEWWTVEPLRSAARAVSLGGGGVVALIASIYPPEFTEARPMTFPNVTFAGAGRPEFADGFSRLTGGTVCQGPFTLDAPNVAVQDLGVDSGSAVCTTLYGGTAQEGLVAPNIGQAVNRPLRSGIRISRVSVLGKAANSPTHGILVESALGALVEDVETIYGTNGVVLKTRRSTVRNALCRAHETNFAIDKSDAYAISIENTWENVRGETLAGSTTGPFRIQAATAASGGHVLRGVAAKNVTQAVSLEPSGSNTITDITITGLRAEAVRFLGIGGSGAISRLKVTDARVVNVLERAAGADYTGQAIELGAGVDDVQISGAQITNTAGDGIRSAATNVLVTGSTVINPGSGRVGYNAVGGTMKVPAGSNIGTTAGSVTV